VPLSDAVLSVRDTSYVTLLGLDIHCYPTGSYNPANPVRPAGSVSTGLSVKAHGVIVKDSYFHDCSDLVLSFDSSAGDLTIENCFGERSGGLAPNTPALSHGYYITTNQIHYPKSRVRILGGYLRNIAGNGIKSRSAYITIAYARIEMANVINANPSASIANGAYYGIQLTGPQGPNAEGAHAADVLGCVVQVKTGEYAPVFIGGDGTSVDSRNNVRLVKNTFLVPPLVTSPLIQLKTGFRSIAAIDNAVIHSDGSAGAVTILAEVDVPSSWISNRLVLVQTNGLPTIPALLKPQIGSAISLAGGSFVATGTAIQGAATANVALTANSVLAGTGTDLSTYVLPASYSLNMPLEPFTLRAPSSPPAWGVTMTLASGPANSKNVGAG
jgi:hypothetical protein